MSNVSKKKKGKNTNSNKNANGNSNCNASASYIPLGCLAERKSSLALATRAVPATLCFYDFSVSLLVYAHKQKYSYTVVSMYNIYVSSYCFCCYYDFLSLLCVASFILPPFIMVIVHTYIHIAHTYIVRYRPIHTYTCEDLFMYVRVCKGFCVAIVYWHLWRAICTANWIRLHVTLLSFLITSR